MEGLGQLTKWDALRQETDEASFEGCLCTRRCSDTDAGSHGESVVGSFTYHDQRLRDYHVRVPHLPTQDYLTPTNFNVSGGFFATRRRSWKFKPERRSEEVPYLIQQLGINGAIFNSHVMLSEREADMPFILNRGSVPFAVENTRSTRLLSGLGV